MAIDLTQSGAQTYLNFIDNRALKYYKEIPNVIVNKNWQGSNYKVIEQNPSEGRRYFLKYSYVYLGAFYRNLIESAYYKEKLEDQIISVSLFTYIDNSTDLKDKMKLGKNCGGYYLYKNSDDETIILPCYFFYDIEEDIAGSEDAEVTFERVYCISPQFRIMIERTDADEPKMQKNSTVISGESDLSNPYQRQMFQKDQTNTGATLSLKITNLKTGAENNFSYSDTSARAGSSSINVCFNTGSGEGDQQGAMISIEDSDLKNFTALCDKLLYIYYNSTEELKTISGRTITKKKEIFPFLEADADHNPEISLNIQPYEEEDDNNIPGLAYQALRENMIIDCEINMASFFNLFPENYDAAGDIPSGDIDTTGFSVEKVYETWKIRKAQGSATGATEQWWWSDLKDLMMAGPFRTIFKNAGGNINWNWDNLSFLNSLPFDTGTEAGQNNAMVLDNLIGMILLYQSFSEYCSFNELEFNPKCGVSSKPAELLSEDEYEKEVARNYLEKAYNSIGSLIGDKKKIQFITLDRQEGVSRNEYRMLESIQIDPTENEPKGIDPYFNGIPNNLLCLETSGNMSRFCAINVGGQTRYYPKYMYKTLFKTDSGPQPYDLITRTRPNIHVSLTPNCLVADGSGSANLSHFLVMKKKGDESVNSGNYCFVYLHGSQHGALSLENLNQSEWTVRNIVYQNDVIGCLPSPSDNPTIVYNSESVDFYQKLLSILGNNFTESQFYDGLVDYVADTTNIPNSGFFQIYTDGVLQDIDVAQRTRLVNDIRGQKTFLMWLNSFYERVKGDSQGRFDDNLKTLMDNKLSYLDVESGSSVKRYHLPMTANNAIEQISVVVITANGEFAQKIFVKEYQDSTGQTVGSGKWTAVYSFPPNNPDAIYSLRDGYEFVDKQPVQGENPGYKFWEVFKSGIYHQGGDDRLTDTNSNKIYPEDDDYSTLYRNYAKWGWSTINQEFGNNNPAYNPST